MPVSEAVPTGAVSTGAVSGAAEPSEFVLSKAAVSIHGGDWGSHIVSCGGLDWIGLDWRVGDALVLEERRDIDGGCQANQAAGAGLGTTQNTPPESIRSLGGAK